MNSIGLDELLAVLPVALYWTDDELNIVGCSGLFLQELGLNGLEELNEATDPRDLTLDRQVLETGRALPFREEELILAGNSPKAVSMIRVPLRSGEAGASGVLGAWTDVSESVRYRDRLTRRKDFLARLVEALPVGFFAKDPSDGFSYRIWNRKMQDIFGYSPAEAVEKRDWNLFGAAAAEELVQHDRDLLEGGEDGSGPRHYRLLGKNGQRTVALVRVPLYDDLLETTLVAGVVDDITRESELEEQLLQAQKMEAVGRLAGGVAHDFNNLLQVIMGAAEIGSSSPEEAGEYFAEVLKAGEKAVFLTKQLLSFSREEPFNRRPFLLDPRVREFVELLQRMVEENISLRFVPGAAGISINADPFQLEQVLMNLIVNARDALEGKADGEIRVATGTGMHICGQAREPEMCAVISVHDNGKGIPAELQGRIFEPFFTTKSEGKGTGLGLASSYAIVTRHDGLIKVHSSAAEGTSFDVCIPVCSGGDAAAARREDGSDHCRGTGGLRVLLAEDEEMVRKVALTILERAGHSVVEAGSGTEAVETFMADPQGFDVLVFDAMMPGLSGREAFTEIHRRDPGMPCVFCTGYSGDSLLGLFGSEARVSVLQKPYSTGDLIRAVSNITR